MKEPRGNDSGCQASEPLLSSYAAGALDETSEGRVRDHLAVCAGCRALLAGRDPAVLFLGMRRTPVPEGVVEGIAAGVRRRLETESRSRLPVFDWIAALGARRAAYVAAPLMTLLLLGTLFIVRPGGPRIRGIGNLTQGGVKSPYPLPHAPGRPLGSRLPQGARPVVPLAHFATDSATPPVLEEVGSPGARVYRFAVGDGAEESPIYFVVDESIDF